jgi:hypothetical protein
VEDAAVSVRRSHDPGAWWADSARWTCVACGSESSVCAERCWNCEADQDGNPPPKEDEDADQA